MRIGLETLEREDITQTFPQVAQLRIEGEGVIIISDRELTTVFIFIKSMSGVKDTDLTTSRSDAESFVHCECDLAVATRPLILRKIKIRVSKSCCWLCLEFLAEYSNQFGKMVVSATHGKTYHSWLFSSEVSHIVRDRMEQTARMGFAR